MIDLRPAERLVAPPPRRTAARWRRRLGPAALASVLLHGALLGAAVFWIRRTVPIAVVPVDTPATVQLVMSPPGGDTPSAAAPQPETQPAPPTPEATAAVPQPTPPAQATADSAPPPTSAPPPPAPAAPPQSDNKLTFDFAPVESDTNALVTGDLMVPASPDVKYHNRKPSYPNSAVFRGEQGAVVLIIHVSAEGLVSGVDVAQSSGYAELDRAARDAVLTWHFMPSVKDGQPVPDDIPMRFVFALD